MKKLILSVLIVVSSLSVYSMENNNNSFSFGGNNAPMNGKRFRIEDDCTLTTKLNAIKNDFSDIQSLTNNFTSESTREINSISIHNIQRIEQMLENLDFENSILNGIPPVEEAQNNGVMTLRRDDDLNSLEEALNQCFDEKRLTKDEKELDEARKTIKEKEKKIYKREKDILKKSKKIREQSRELSEIRNNKQTNNIIAGTIGAGITVALFSVMSMFM